MKIFAVTLISMVAASTEHGGNPTEATLKAAGYPECSFPCLRNMVERTGCPSFDLACFCRPDKRDIQAKCIMSTKCKPEQRQTILELDAKTCAAIPGVPGLPHNPAVTPENQDGHGHSHDHSHGHSHSHGHTHSHDHSHGVPGNSDPKDIKVINTTVPKDGEPANKTATPSNSSSPDQKTNSGIASITYMPSFTIIALLGAAAIVAL